MTIKSLSITEDAYEALKAMKLGEESFSETILRLSSERVGGAARFLGVWKEKPEAVAALKKRVRDHRRDFERDAQERQRRFFGQRARK